MKLILSSFKGNIDANDDQANVIGQAEHLEVNIDANDDQADDNTDDQADDNTDDQADDNTDINDILWNIQLNFENRVRPQLPQPERFEINNEINNFGDLIQWIINNRVTIQVSKYATGG